MDATNMLCYDMYCDVDIIFEAACDHFDVRPEEAVHIGNDCRSA